MPGRSTRALAAMHFTLTRWFNALLMVLWATALYVLLRTTAPLPLWNLAVGIVLGATAGRLQRRALSAGPAELTASQTALSLRKSMMATPAGKWSIWLKWANSIGQLVWAMAFAPDMFVGAWLVGVVAFWLAREVAAFPAVFRWAAHPGSGAGHGS